jgi:carbamoyl-phosphate synthase large subunit
MMKVPYFTTVNGINSATQAVIALREGRMEVKALQSYFA